MSYDACLRKRQYTSEPKAWSIIFKMRAQGSDTEKLQPYRCAFCLHWHLGNPTPAPAMHPKPPQRVAMPYKDSD